MTAGAETPFEETPALLAADAEVADTSATWPKASWQHLAQAGVLAWAIPKEFGGQEWGPAELLLGYERLAGACLTTAFILPIAVACLSFFSSLLFEWKSVKGVKLGMGGPGA